MNGLMSGDLGFSKAKAQTLCLYPNLHLSEMDYFKEVADGRLVEEMDQEPSKELKASDVEQPKETPTPNVGGDGKIVNIEPAT